MTQTAPAIEALLTEHADLELRLSDPALHADAPPSLVFGVRSEHVRLADAAPVRGEVFGVEAAARKVAKDFPKTWFLMGSSGKPQAPNFSVFDNYIQEPAYLSGMIAGGMTKTNKIGMVGGFPIPEVNRLMNAFMAGAKEVNPKVEFSVSFINSWFDPPKAKEATFAMIDQGADVLYAERFGVSDAAKEKGKLAIGNVINTGWPEQWIRILGKRIQRIHLKEFSRQKADKEGKWAGFSVEFLKGSNDWPAIMKALAAIGYTGWGIAEQGGGGSDIVCF